jgi:hypothetical protein
MSPLNEFLIHPVPSVLGRTLARSWLSLAGLIEQGKFRHTSLCVLIAMTCRCSNTSARFDPQYGPATTEPAHTAVRRSALLADLGTPRIWIGQLTPSQGDLSVFLQILIFSSGDKFVKLRTNAIMSRYGVHTIIAALMLVGVQAVAQTATTDVESTPQEIVPAETKPQNPEAASERSHSDPNASIYTDVADGRLTTMNAEDGSFTVTRYDESRGGMPITFRITADEMKGVSQFKLARNHAAIEARYASHQHHKDLFDDNKRYFLVAHSTTEADYYGSGTSYWLSNTKTTIVGGVTYYKGTFDGLYTVFKSVAVAKGCRIDFTSTNQTGYSSFGGNTSTHSENRTGAGSSWSDMVVKANITCTAVNDAIALAHTGKSLTGALIPIWRDGWGEGEVNRLKRYQTGTNSITYNDDNSDSSSIPSIDIEYTQIGTNKRRAANGRENTNDLWETIPDEVVKKIWRFATRSITPCFPRSTCFAQGSCSQASSTTPYWRTGITLAQCFASPAIPLLFAYGELSRGVQAQLGISYCDEHGMCLPRGYQDWTFLPPR